MTDLHLVVLCHQAGLQFLRVSILLQQVQGQLLVQALLGQKRVLQRGSEMDRRHRTQRMEKETISTARASPNKDKAYRRPRLRKVQHQTETARQSINSFFRTRRFTEVN